MISVISSGHERHEQPYWLPRARACLAPRAARSTIASRGMVPPLERAAGGSIGAFALTRSAERSFSRIAQASPSPLQARELTSERRVPSRGESTSQRARSCGRTRAPARLLVGRIRSCAAAPIGPGRDDAYVAVGVVRSEAVQIAKAVVREMRGFRALGDSDPRDPK